MRLLRALDTLNGLGWTLGLVVLRVMVLVIAAALIWLLLSGRLIGS
jgi:hypothetical protein